MNIKLIKISITVICLISAFFLLASEAFFIVTNSNRDEFFAEGEPQNMSSGLYSSYIHEDNHDYSKIKAKGGLLIDFDLDGDLDLTYGYSSSYYFKNEESINTYLNNVSSSLKVGGRFIGTCLNGNNVFEQLGPNESISNMDETLCWKITKKYKFLCIIVEFYSFSK